MAILFDTEWICIIEFWQLHRSWSIVWFNASRFEEFGIRFSVVECWPFITVPPLSKIVDGSIKPTKNSNETKWFNGVCLNAIWGIRNWRNRIMTASKEDAVSIMEEDPFSFHPIDIFVMDTKLLQEQVYELEELNRGPIFIILLCLEFIKSYMWIVFFFCSLVSTIAFLTMK